MLTSSQSVYSDRRSGFNRSEKKKHVLTMTVNANKKRKHKNKIVDDNYGHICPNVLDVVKVSIVENYDDDWEAHTWPNCFQH